MRAIYGVTTGISLLLTGCGGGIHPAVPSEPEASSPASPEQPFFGLWQGTMDSIVAGDSHQLIGLLDYDGWGSMILFTPQAQLQGLTPPAGSDFTVTLTGIRSTSSSWPDGSRISKIHFDGQSPSDAAGSRVEGVYSGAGDQGEFSLAFDPASLRGSDIGRTAGMWALRDELQNIVATFEITAAGSTKEASINGSDVNSCQYTGMMEGNPWYSSYIYPVLLSVENCSPASTGTVNGSYEGGAAVTDIVAGEDRDDRLYIAVNDNTNIVTLALEKL
jgi:hypothetical protein